MHSCVQVGNAEENIGGQAIDGAIAAHFQHRGCGGSACCRGGTFASRHHGIAFMECMQIVGDVESSSVTVLYCSRSVGFVM